ncbi:MAG: hypothetical protein OEO79_07110 [Gemmatimonadota bacterium]|nr:hypothetical protein [Gemmatimonadota bacterium]MDH3424390.1 hypothetical protein [Gemmatimonadota bacterium]
MSRSEWERHVVTMCSDAWQLGPYVTKKVVEGLEFLVVSDSVSDFTVAEVLCGVGVDGAEAEMAAPGIRATIKRSR